MKSIKDYIITGLICVNAFLITSLLIEKFDPTPVAFGQVVENDYMITPGNMQLGKQMLWIIDLKSFQLTNCYFDPSSDSIVFGQIRSL